MSREENKVQNKKRCRTTSAFFQEYHRVSFCRHCCTAGMSDMPTPSNPEFQILCYADKIIVFYSDEKPENAVERINRYLEKLDAYLKEMQLFARPLHVQRCLFHLGAKNEEKS